MAAAVPALVEVVEEQKPSIGVKWSKEHSLADEDLQVSNTAMRTVACTSDTILTGSSKPVVKVWKVTESKFVEESRLRHGAVGTTCVEVAADERTVAVCSDDGLIGIWDLRANKRIGELSSTIPMAWKVKFVGGHDRIVSGGPAGALAIWDLKKNCLEREVEPDVMANLDTTSEPLSVAKRARSEPEKPRTAEKGASPIYSLAVSENGRLIGCGRGNGGISIMRLDSYDWASDISAHHSEVLPPVRGLAFDASGKLLLSGGDDSHVCVLNAAAWARRRNLDEPVRMPQIERFPAHKGWVTSVSISPDPNHRVAITTSWDNTVKLWDYGTHALIHKESHTDSVFDSAFAPSNAGNNFFVTVGADAVLAMYVAKDTTAK